MTQITDHVANGVASAASTATIGGSGTAVVSGAVAANELIYGLTPPEWSFIGVVGGLVIGLVGLAVNAWFKHKQLEIMRERAQ